MKSETYNALAALNRGSDLMLESLTILKQQDVVTGDYVQQQLEIIEETRSGINGHIHGTLQAREEDDHYNYGKMRETTEKRLQSEQESS